MAWTWLRRRADRGNVPVPAAPPPTAPASVAHNPDWPHLPPVQRTLARPLSPVAPLDAFAAALTAHQNPSFLGSLGHHVDPAGPGGLITGLTAPGRAVPYAGTADLTVPAPALTRPAVQRQVVGWSTTVETAGPASPGPFPAPAENESLDAGPPPAPRPERPAPDRTVLQHQLDLDPVGPTAPPVGDPAVVEQPPVLEPDGDRRHETNPAIEPSGASSHPTASTPFAAVKPTLSASTPVPAVQRRLAVVPQVRPRTASLPPRSTVTLPVVTRRAADPPLVVARTPTTPPNPPLSAAPVPSSDALSPDPPMAPAQEPTGEAAITPLLGETGPLPTLPDPTPTSYVGTVPTETVPLSYDVLPDETSPVIEPTAAADLTMAPTPLAPPTTAAPNDLAPPPGRPSPDPGRVVGTAPVSPVDPGDRPRAGTSEGVAPRAEPTVQRSLVGHQEPIVQRTPVAPPKPAVRAVPVEDLAPAGPTTPLSGFAARIIALTGEPPVPPALAPAALPVSAPTPELVAVAVQRHVVLDAPAVRMTEEPGVVPLPTASLVANRPPLRSVRNDLSSAVAPAAPVQRASFAPAVRTSDAYAATPLAGRRGEPIRVSVPAADFPAPTLRHEPPGTPVGPAPPPGLPTRPAALPVPATPVVQRSFAAMFAGAAATTTPTAPTGEPERAQEHAGFTTVQLQTAAAEPTPPPAAEPVPETPAPTPVSPAPTAADAPPAGTAAADLDEMARRLFEPLSARLRAELWLDRERAGLVTDARH